MEQFEKVIHYPNKFSSFKGLEPQVQAIVKDRGNKFRYRTTVSQEKTTTISCMMPSGIIVTGVCFFNPQDENYNGQIGLKIAAGRLEGSLKYFDDLHNNFRRFTYLGKLNSKWVDPFFGQAVQATQAGKPAPAPAQSPY